MSDSPRNTSRPFLLISLLIGLRRTYSRQDLGRRNGLRVLATTKMVGEIGNLEFSHTFALI